MSLLKLFFSCFLLLESGALTVFRALRIALLTLGLSDCFFAAISAQERPVPVPEFDLVFLRPLEPSDSSGGEADSAAEKKFREAMELLRLRADTEQLSRARALLKEASSKGHATAALYHAYMAQTGRGGGVDLIAAESDYIKAARANLIAAYNNIGCVYAQGIHGKKPEYDKALKWFERGCEAGEVVALSNAATLHFFGLGTERNTEKALDLLIKAANLGHIPAATRAGILLCDGHEMPADLGRGIPLLRRAADAGNSSAAYALAILLIEGKGVPQDPAGAARWLKRSAEDGHPYAMTNLGALYEEGRGVPQDLKQAAVLYRAATEKGASFAAYNLGRLYRNGLGVEKDLHQAIKLFEQAANDGMPAALNELGEMVRDGIGTERDAARAEELFKEAAEKGVADAAVNLATIRLLKNDIEQRTLAVETLQLHAEAGNAHAQNNLGVALRDGRGISRNYAAAVGWFKKAAAQNLAAAYCNLGFMFEFGLGVDLDDSAAIRHYRLAAALGSDYAKAKLARLGETF